MSNNLIQYAFVSGEISPTLFGRSDLEKYDLGVALARNFFVDYRGGLSTRPGTRFVDFIKHDDKPTKLVRFRYAPAVAETYVILFGQGYIRFIQDGGYVLEEAKTITGVTQANPGVVTAAGHGFSAGDWIKISGAGGMTELNGRTFEVGATTTNTFELLDPFGNKLDTTEYGAYTSGGTVSRIYTLSSPYAVSDLAELKAHQRKNVIILTHKDYKPSKLTRNGHTDWTLATVDFSNNVPRPTGLTLTPSDTSGSGGGYTGVVTAIDQEGRESLPSARVSLTTMNSDTTSDSSFYNNGYVTWSWTAVADAAYYHIYRSSYVRGGGNHPTDMGFLQKVYGTTYRDQNSLPDFTRVPPNEYNPFSNGRVLYINVTNGGSGYSANGTTVSVAGGTGFVGQVIVSPSGAVEAVIVLSGGSGYPAGATVTISGAGTGATATAVVSPQTGNYPALSTVYQQRQIYAATENQPLTIFGSRVKEFENFSISDVVTESDGYEFELDTEDVSPIRHILPTRGGLLAMTQSGIWLLTGGADEAISSINALADPQAYNGCSSVPPIPIDTDILYIEGKGSTVRLLSYNDFSKVYGGTNMSILANHLFRDNNPIIEWTYAETPHNLVWARRKDGALLAFTFVKEQNVYAWTQCWTRGLFDNVLSIQEDNIDTTYVTVKRYINGRWTKFIEQFDSRLFEDIEDAWCVDCGLALGNTKPNADITFSAASGDSVTVTASASVFSADDVDKVIRGGGGKALITAFVSGTQVTVQVIKELTSVIPETDPGIPLTIESGDWTLDAQVTTISGLWHLEGETLVGLADGNVVEDLTVSNGSVTLPHAASRVILGLGYTCIAQTLPPVAQDVIIENRSKDIIGSAVRMNDTRGLKVGASLDNLYEFKERTNEAWGEPIRMQNGVETILIEADWNTEGQTYYVQEYPLPATVLGIVVDLEVGDDND